MPPEDEVIGRFDDDGERVSVALADRNYTSNITCYLVPFSHLRRWNRYPSFVH